MIVNPLDAGVAILGVANMILALTNENIHSFLGWLLVTFVFTCRALGH